MNGSILVVVPVLARPHRVAPLAESLAASTPAPWRLRFVCDPDDDDEIAACEAVNGEVQIVGGTYAEKINAAAVCTNDDYVFTGADDLRFHAGWAEAAVAVMSDRVGVVGTNDMGNPRVKRGRHATHSLVARWYIDRHGTIDEPGKILHEGYGHNFCDDELVATARRRRAYAFAMRSRVEHLHPNWHPNVERDAVYAKGQATFEQDRAVYLSRARLWR